MAKLSHKNKRHLVLVDHLEENKNLKQLRKKLKNLLEVREERRPLKL